MALAYLLDEHLRGPLWNAVQRHNRESENAIDAVRVGDSPDLPLGSDDLAILQWAERAGRIVVTEDKHTMPKYLAEHLRSGQHSPGVFMLRAGTATSELIECLVLVAFAGDESEFRDAVTFVP